VKPFLAAAHGKQHVSLDAEEGADDHPGQVVAGPVRHRDPAAVAEVLEVSSSPCRCSRELRES